MPEIIAQLDTHLRAKLDQLPADIADDISNELMFPNRERELLKREKRYGWQNMPTKLALWEIDGDDFVMPRGFRWTFEQGMADLGYEVKIDDRRVGKRTFSIQPPFEHYRDHQPDAAAAILKHQDGIYQAPPGSGKTVTVLEVVRRAGMERNIIVVNTIDIAEQWRENAQRFLGSGFPVGLIGDGIWEDGRIIIATQQTLYSRLADLDRDRWWDQFGLSCLDECHHQTARTFREVMARFRSLLRFGVSATPSKTGDFEWALAVLGDVIHCTTRHELRESGILIQPVIRVRETDFQFPFHSTFTANKIKGCGIRGCPKDKKTKHTHYNNYQQLLRALREDPNRNMLVARDIVQERGHKGLVVSDNLAQLNMIQRFVEQCGWPTKKMARLTGAEGRVERRQIAHSVESADEIIIFSTVADEALDIPPLDRVFMPHPTRNGDKVRQIVGRGERAHPSKDDYFAHDYVDRNVPVLRNQFLARRWDVYAPDLMKVEYDGLDEACYDLSYE